MRPILTIKFVSKARRNKSTWARDRLIVDFIKRRLRAGLTEEIAKNDAEDYFRLERARVAEIWQQHKILGHDPSNAFFSRMTGGEYALIGMARN